MDKSPDAFRTISEVAEELDVPQHVLRFWESKFHQIKPLKRGGGRRYYRPADVNLVGGIKQLLYGEGYTIKGVQKILREQGIAHVQAVTSADGAAAAPDMPPAEQVVAEAPIAAPPVSPVRSPAKTAKIEPSIAAPIVRPIVRPIAAATSPGPNSSGPDSPKPNSQSLANNHLRMLKAVLFELSELKMLFESAPEAPGPRQKD